MILTVIRKFIRRCLDVMEFRAVENIPTSRIFSYNNCLDNIDECDSSITLVSLALTRKDAILTS